MQLEKHIFEKFHDPRVCFAINSASWSSPRLPKVYNVSTLCIGVCLHKGITNIVHEPHLQELYDPNQLQVQLHEQADSFINREASQLHACYYVTPEVSLDAYIHRGVVFLRRMIQLPH